MGKYCRVISSFALFPLLWIFLNIYENLLFDLEKAKILEKIKKKSINLFRDSVVKISALITFEKNYPQNFEKFEI